MSAVDRVMDEVDAVARRLARYRKFVVAVVGALSQLVVDATGLGVLTEQQAGAAQLVLAFITAVGVLAVRNDTDTAPAPSANP